MSTVEEYARKLEEARDDAYEGREKQAVEKFNGIVGDGAFFPSFGHLKFNFI